MHIRIFLCLAAVCPLLSTFDRTSSAEEPISFNRHIRPILSDKCFACHGFDSKKRMAELRLDTVDGATADLGGRQAIVPGDLNASQLWRRIQSSDESEVMPPPESHKTLSDEEKGWIRRWIEQGAVYQKHWSFEEPHQSALPKQSAYPSSASQHPIDAFLGAKLESLGWKGQKEASREILIRRVAFTLTGLPPTVDQVDRFLADRSPQAYDRMLDEFFQSSHHGEEMARHWLDIARYADTHGLHLDNERQMWAYRDWVVSAFNQNMPFDQFSIEQLAGDLLPNATNDQLIATGFNRCNVTTSEGGSIDSEYIFRYAVDRTATTVQAWMGLTAGCATCHDHKFDPLTQKEFYSMYAMFLSAADPAMDGNALLTAPTMKLMRTTDQQRLAEIDKQIASKENELLASVTKIAYSDPASQVPPPPAEERDTLWFDDGFPSGAKTQSSGPALQLVTADQGPVFAGVKSLKRSSGGLTQDFYSEGAAPLSVPQKAEIFLHVYLDPASMPKTIMIQFHKGDWLHRAVWGDYDAIEFGQKGTTQRVHMGTLPEAGKWVRLAFPAEKVGLNAGDALTGFAVTQFDGTVYWDSIGVHGVSDPANDPSISFIAWWKSFQGKDANRLPESLRKIAAAGPEGSVQPEELLKLKSHYLANECASSKEFVTPYQSELQKLRANRQAIENEIPSTFIYKDLDQPRESFVMMRGAYDKPGDRVEPGTPEILPPLKKKSNRANRLDFAQWLFHPDHPLTARVAVNRLWQQVYGVGLVKTSGDFGSQGEPPSHPELLDWLALEYRNSGWDTRHMLRLMLTSASFRQASVSTPDLVKADPENRFLARGPRMRLEAEQIRDNALFVSGLIKLDLGGKGVKPYQPANIWEPVGFAGSNTRFYQQDSGDALYRRSIYTFLKRTAPPPFMANFDAPNREQLCVVRERSNTPMQALQLMNDVQQVEAARHLAERMLEVGGPDTTSKLRFAFRTVLSRLPTSDEIAILEEQLQTHRARYANDAASATQLISLGASKPTIKTSADELAAYTLVASTLLNLDETVTRN